MLQQYPPFEKRKQTCERGALLALFIKLYREGSSTGNNREPALPLDRVSQLPWITESGYHERAANC